MTISYFIQKTGNFYEVWDSTADWVDTFDTEGEAFACIASLEAADQQLHQQHHDGENT